MISDFSTWLKCVKKNHWGKFRLFFLQSREIKLMGGVLSTFNIHVINSCYLLLIICELSKKKVREMWNENVNFRAIRGLSNIDWAFRCEVLVFFWTETSVSSFQNDFKVWNYLKNLTKTAFFWKTNLASHDFKSHDFISKSRRFYALNVR